ncbi:BrnA antitoxin family protein [Amaricoccus sp.]|uniref:BrnA antitoxin family protein n=1 Tax=Amaricoccus sp. TaxID=1872485 RepID=UPI0026269C4E|nr:BrnA antitoxin family protein [Amaricoccus sp.]HRO13346.1 BrnA antitoxin family protein [Amaricoccus sp.]
MFEERRRNIEQERAHFKFMLELERQEEWLKDFKLRQLLVPPEWHRIESRVPVRPHKTKLTAAFDADVVKWFRRMGHGYQARMNAVLRAYMLALISKHILSEGDTNREGDEIWGLPAKKEKKEE